MITKLALVFILIGGLAGCSPRDKEPEAKPASEEKAGGASEHKDPLVVSLEKESLQKLGLEVKPLGKATKPQSVRGFGRVADATLLATAVADQTAATASAEASQADLKRLQSLAAQDNASERALQTARANALRDQAVLQSNRLKLISAWGATLIERQDLPELINSLVTLSNALLDISLPVGAEVADLGKEATVFAVGQEGQGIPAEVLGPVPSVDVQLQGKRFWVLVKENNHRLAPGEMVAAVLNRAAPEVPGALIPLEALVHYQGAVWCFVQEDPTSFRRIEVQPEAPLPGGWFVREPKPDTPVVTRGAQQLLSEQLKSEGGE